MAVENRGGMRPTAPQNNPNRISPMGGNGQSGKKAAKAMELRPSGGSYGATKALNEQIAGAPGVAGTAPAASSMPAPAPMRGNAMMPPVTPLTAPTEFPDEDISAMPEGLGLPGGMENEKYNFNVQSYYSVLSYIAGRDDTSEDTRQIINTLMRVI